MTAELLDIAPSALTPYSDNPRKLDTLNDDWTTFVDDIRENGIRTRLICRRVGDIVEVLAGHRRRQAAIDAGLDTVPVEVRDVGDADALVLVCAENFGRADLKPSEEVESCKLLSNAGYDADSIAHKIGKPREWVQLRLDLPSLGGSVMHKLDSGTMDVRIAQELLRVDDDHRDTAVQTVMDMVGSDPVPIAVACRMLHESFIVPARLERAWQEWCESNAVITDQVDIVPVMQRGEYVMAWGDTAKGWQRGDERIPDEQVTKQARGTTWSELAAEYGLTVMLVPSVDGEHITGAVWLVNEREVRDAANASAENGGRQVFAKQGKTREKKASADSYTVTAGDDERTTDDIEAAIVEIVRLLEQHESVTISVRRANK